MARIEILFKAADQIAQAVLNNRIPLAEKILDPMLFESCQFEPVSWPESWLRYKEKVRKAEEAFGREPLTPHQWKGVELYLSSQYGLEL